MLFTSTGYLIFLPLVFMAYYLIGSKKRQWQNRLLLAAGYYFYACWDWRFLFLLIFSTALDYYTGLKIDRASNKRHRKIWLLLSVGINLGLLGFFKYYNFFTESFSELLQQLGIKVSDFTLNIILPVGISFYTFHGLSYLFDIYKGRIKPTSNIIDYALFVGFFPLLVAGPIERAGHLLPQIEKPRFFDCRMASDGLRQILWGLFKKLVIADSCGVYVDMIFDDPGSYSGSTLALGAIFFAFQIYGDFSGYTDIAIGSARLFGFEILQNFRFPYFSKSMAEFWRRWHISLSSWFRDYLYIPLGGSRVNTSVTIRNVMLIFLLTGRWHGANWTFVVWGLVNAVFVLPSVVFRTKQTPVENRPLTKTIQILLTFFLTCFAWIFFRAENLDHAFFYISRMISPRFFQWPDPAIISRSLIGMIILFLAVEWWGRTGSHALENLVFVRFRIYRWSFYAVLIFLMGMFMQSSGRPFIYFQF